MGLKFRGHQIENLTIHFLSLHIFRGSVLLLEKLARLLILLMMPNVGQAELVQVQMDAVGSGAFTGGGYAISRTATNFVGTVSDNGSAGCTID